MENQVGGWEQQCICEAFQYASILGDVVADVTEWDAALGNDVPCAALILDTSEGRPTYSNSAWISRSPIRCISHSVSEELWGARSEGSTLTR